MRMKKTEKQDIAATAAQNGGNAPTGCVTTTVTTRTVSIRSYSTTRGKTLSPGARGRMDRFYSQIDWDLAKEERELRRKAKKERRKAKRRLKRLLKAATANSDPKLRAEAQSRIIDLLDGRSR